MVWAEIATMLGVVALVYTFLRNFKSDLKADLKEKFDGINSRMDRSDDRITSLEERMFLMATGKTLAEAILDEKIKRGMK